MLCCVYTRVCIPACVCVCVLASQTLTVLQNLSMKLAEKETEIEQLREELRAAKALEDQLRKVRSLESVLRTYTQPAQHYVATQRTTHSG